MALRWLALLLFLDLSPAARGSAQIDPAIYERLFKGNQPIFDKMARLAQRGIQETSADAKALAKKQAGKLTASLRLVLDLGSGPGEPGLTFMSREAGMSTHIIVTDFQEAMVNKARKRFLEYHKKKPEMDIMDRSSFEKLSADDLSSIDDHDFDVVMANYVMMFVPNKQKAFEEIARVLKIGIGRAYVSVWKHLPMYDIAHAAVKEVAGLDSMGDLDVNPLALKGANSVGILAASAVLKVAEVHNVTYSFPLGNVKEATESLLILAGQKLKKLEETNPKATEQFHAVAERMLGERGWISEGKVTFPDCMAELSVLKHDHEDFEDDSGDDEDGDDDDEAGGYETEPPPRGGEL